MLSVTLMNKKLRSKCFVGINKIIPAKITQSGPIQGMDGSTRRDSHAECRTDEQIVFLMIDPNACYT